MFDIKNFTRGMRASVPIALGYLGVSAGFGASSNTIGLTFFQSILISLTNLTSAGQFAGINVIAASGTIIEIFLSQLLINCRYSLMSISLNMKIEKKITLPQKFLFSFFNTDEIFAVAYDEDPTTFDFYLGLSLPPFFGWTLGTCIGYIASSVFPAFIGYALNIMLYAMFIAIIIPKVSTEFKFFVCFLIAASISCIIYYVPALSFISTGLSIIISTLFASAFCAMFFNEKGEVPEI